MTRTIKISRFDSLVNRFLPSSTAPSDPLRVLNGAEGEFAPVPVNEIKLIRPVREIINSYRSTPISPRRLDTGKLALIIPFRNRHAHLEETAPAVAAKLRGQGVEHEVLVIQQEAGKPFNRGKLLNVGAMEASGDSGHFCFHDVDFYPLEVDYRPCTHPLRLPARIKACFREQYTVGSSGRVSPVMFSGVVMVSKDTYFRANGHSNDYWHWGYEDVDFMMRLLLVGEVPLYDPKGVFRALYHPPSVQCDEEGRADNSASGKKRLRELYGRNRKRYSRAKRMAAGNEGGLSDLRYEVLGREARGLYTLITVRI